MSDGNMGPNGVEAARLPDAALLRDFLAKGWLTHDGMWFYNVYRELGIDMANRLNLAAIRAMVPPEVRRIRKLLGVKSGQIDRFQDLYSFMISALQIALPASLLGKFTTGVPAPNTFRWEWEKGECFAFKGVSMLGCIDRYECGVLLRIKCWLDELGVEHRFEPEIGCCMMHEKGYCRGDIVCCLGRDDDAHSGETCLKAAAPCAGRGKDGHDQE